VTGDGAADREFLRWFGPVLALRVVSWGLLFLAGKALLGL
jgi:hypothetical protein